MNTTKIQALEGPARVVREISPQQKILRIPCGRLKSLFGGRVFLIVVLCLSIILTVTTNMGQLSALNALSIWHNDMSTKMTLQDTGNVDTNNLPSSFSSAQRVTTDKEVHMNFDDWFSFLREQAVERNESATFVQIGANDGKKNDPSYKHWRIGTKGDTRRSWVGLLVEPTVELYRQLTELHRDVSKWSFYRGAVVPTCHTKNKTVDFWVSPTSGDDSKRIGNFLEQGQVNSANPKSHWNKALKQVSVPCVQNVTELLQKKASPEFIALTQKTSTLWRFDVLQIDVECLDSDLIADIDWKLVRPRIIHFEAVCTNMPKALKTLLEHGYLVGGGTQGNQIAFDSSMLTARQSFQ